MTMQLSKKFLQSAPDSNTKDNNDRTDTTTVVTITRNKRVRTDASRGIS